MHLGFRHDSCNSSLLKPLQMIKFLAFVVVTASSVFAAEQSHDAAGLEFFETKVRPILVDHCYKCHSPEAEKIKGGLLLDTREHLLKGGDTGPAILPGDPEKSLLIKAVRYSDENLQMPPKGKKLSEEQIADLETWVKMGAPDPRMGKTKENSPTIAEKARTHWAFQPVREPAIPRVRNEAWVKTPVDAFILEKLEAKDLKPSHAADRRTLIRRATYDLTGLPPKPEEVAAFISDKSPDAFAKLVDRLLASPQYGERWGRYWLDVARYADTKGYMFEEERRYPYSYTYRDYVIRAFNEDLPYNQFILQQIAADQLALGEDKRSLAALGYLTLGRRFVNNIHDIIDDRIDVVCRGMMGFTVSCARCHDHKYDPIPTKDYYSLYGVFASSMEPEEEPLLGIHGDKKAYEEYLAEHKKRVEERDNFRRTKENEMAAQLRHQSGDYLLAAYDAHQLKDKSEEDGLAHKRSLDPGVVHRWMNSLESWGKTNHPIFSPWVQFAALPEKDFGAKAKEICISLASNSLLNSIVARGFATNPPASMKDVAMRYGALLNNIDRRWTEFVAAEAKLTNNPASGSSDARSATLPSGAEEALRQVLYAEDAPPNIPKSEFDRLFDVPTGQRLRALERAIVELDATHPGAPPRATALVDKPNPYNVQVFIRGNTDNRGPEVPRQFLEVLAGPNRKPFQKGSGRLELAQAIASPDNPLTARVLVNRVWLHHFGAGLVKTPSDFGLRSEPPSHPELLDYLASRFLKEAWSIKKLHRLIMLSNSYQQASEESERNAKIDPQNQFFWRMNRQRLDFEALRDTLLAVSGKLDLTQGGRAVDITSTPFTTRRTVYGYIDRQNLPNLFRTFDFASPDTTSPQRFFTTVPQQALFLMNSSFVVEQATNLVQKAEFKNLRSESDRIRFLYQQALQRDPTSEEKQLARKFIETQGREEIPPSLAAWQYGYGEYDEASKRVKAFSRLPHFTGSAFQGGPALPDPALGWVMLNENGGHAGNDLQHAAIRRWVSPRDGDVSIQGALSHGVYQGDGVRGRIVSSSLGELGEWLAHNSKVESDVPTFIVKAGDTIDFVTDDYKTVDHDSFQWDAVLTFTANTKNFAPKKPEIFDSQKDFFPSARLQKKPLNDWEKYAQVLLLANELAFVD